MAQRLEAFWACQERNDLQALASMRHVLAHGNLLPTKAAAVLVHIAQQLQLSIAPT